MAENKKGEKTSPTKSDNTTVVPTSRKNITGDSIDYGESSGKNIEVRNTLPAPPPRPPKDGK